MFIKKLDCGYSRQIFDIEQKAQSFPWTLNAIEEVFKYPYYTVLGAFDGEQLCGFIIFDEIGRGTATYDGMAIAQAVLEYLNGLAARTLFATHYHELTCLVGDSDGKLNKVSCLTIDVREHNNEIVFMHRIVSGVANRSYGIHVAKMAGMPESVVSRAESVLADLESCGTNTATYHPVAPEQNQKSKTASRVESPKSNQLSLFGE